MNLRTIYALDRQEWQGCLGRFPVPDVYFTAEYHRPYECLGDGQACAFCAENGRDFLFYPFMLRAIDRIGCEPVKTGLFDIQTVYGYSGPLCSTAEPSFLSRAWS